MTTARAQAGTKKTIVRVLTFITCLCALPLMISLPGCATARFNQSIDPRIEDSRTAERVREALAATPQYKFDGVQVAASNSAVRLSGFVNTSAQRTRAGEVASKVVGVKSVENNLAVKN